MRETVEIIKVSISSVLGFFTYLLGGGDELLTLLIFLIATDLVTGVMKAIATKTLNAEKMFLGGMKKLAIFIMIIIGVQMELAFNNIIPFREIIIMYYITTEGLSFIENIGHFITLPDQFTKFFVKLKEEEHVKEKEKYYGDH